MSSATTLGQHLAELLDKQGLLYPERGNKVRRRAAKVINSDQRVKELVEDKQLLDWAIWHPEQFHSINMSDPSETLEAAKVRVREAIRAALGTDREQEVLG